MPSPGRGNKCPACGTLTVYEEGIGIWVCSSGDFMAFNINGGWKKEGSTKGPGLWCFRCKSQTLHEAGRTKAGVTKLICPECELHALKLQIWK